MAGILGVGSGIQIDQIVSALVNAEKAPKTQQLDRLEKSTTAKSAALISVKGSLTNFQSSLSAFTSSLFTTRTASSSSSVLSAKADSTASSGKYSLQVQQLASGSKVALHSISSAAGTTLNSGTLKIEAGSTSINVDVTSSNNTLAGVRDAINAAGKDSGISATVVTDASGSRLVLSSSKTGEGNDLKVTATEDGVTSGTTVCGTPGAG